MQSSSAQTCLRLPRYHPPLAGLLNAVGSGVVEERGAVDSGGALMDQLRMVAKQGIKSRQVARDDGIDR